MPTSIRQSTGNARANSSVMFPASSSGPSFRDLQGSIGAGPLLEKRGLGHRRRDAHGIGAVGGAAPDVVIVVRRELDVATDPDGAAGRARVRVVQARYVDPVLREVDRPRERRIVERA